MLYSHYDSIRLADVKEILLSTTTELDSLQGKLASGGILNLGDAMAYDIETLPEQSADNSKPEITKPNTPNADSADSDSAPVIEIETLTYMGSTYLIVTVTDANGDLARTAYASGTLTAEDFKGDTLGTAFDLDCDGSATFLVRDSGSYTFYAQDSEGNETLQVIFVTTNTRQSPIVPLPGSNRSRNGGFRGKAPSFGL